MHQPTVPWSAPGPAWPPGEECGCPLCSVLRCLTSSAGCILGATMLEGHEAIRELPKEGYRDGEGYGGQAA